MACRKGNLSSREPLLILGMNNGDIWRFNPLERVLNQVPQTGRGSISRTLFSPDDNRIAVGDQGGVIHVWNVAD
jgi:hypothetical protein